MTSQEKYSIFPRRMKWPQAIDDVMQTPLDASIIRLVSGAKNVEMLPDFKHLRSLWFFNVKQNALSQICKCNSLESLFIEDIKTEDLSDLRLLTRLKNLGLDSCSKVTSLSALRELQSLVGLSITNFKNVHDLEPLAYLRKLRALVVDGGMWTRMKVNTFKPLEGLENLEILQLYNCKAQDESLRCLGELKNLKQLNLANFYPMEEFAWLSQKLTSTHCTWFQPYVEMTGLVCKKCKKSTMLLLTGKGKPVLCSRCDNKRLEKHLHDWNEAVERASV